MSLTAEQRAERSSGIGGSDAAPAVGVSRFKTPFQLYSEKRGEAPEIEAPDFLRWRSLIEPIVRQEYAERTGNVVRLPISTFRHPKHPHMLVHPDGVTDSRRYFEAKTARSARAPDGTTEWGEPGTDEVPDEYVIQCQHGMLVVAAQLDITIEVADLAVLIGLDDYRVYHIEPDRELQEMLVDEERAFWTRVQKGDAPPITTLDDIKVRYGRASLTGVSQASAEVAAAVHELAELKALMTRAKDEECECLEAKIKLAFGDNDTLVYGGKVLATWRAQKGQRRVDADGLRKKHPAIYEEFETVGDPFRRLLLKVKPQESNGHVSSTAK